MSIATISTGSSFTELVKNQKDAVKKGLLRTAEQRIAILKKLRGILKTHEPEILEALYKDLGKPETEAYAAEILFTYNDIDHHISHLKKWMRPKKVSTSLFNQPGSSYIIPEPYGSVLIISPWNYPVQLLIAPAVAALSAGNAVVLKPSEIARHTESLMLRLINENFDSEIIYVVTGAKEETEALIDARPDYIFFTGSTQVGAIIMQRAAKYLIPVTLELGGKSPCLVTNDANLDVAINRILWGKCMNAGQTCIAPDYILIDQSLLDAFQQKFVDKLKERYGNSITESEDYSKIISEKHYQRLKGMLHGQLIGANYNDEQQKIAPTLLLNPSQEHPAMQEEIFGPILPVLPYQKIEEAITYINKNDKPLALYIFSESKHIADKIIAETSSGGVCINDTIMHIASNSLPFGGVGASGMGAYHGKFGFDTFSHKKSVLKKATWIDPSIRYPPYKLKWSKFEKLFLWLAR